MQNCKSKFQNQSYLKLFIAVLIFAFLIFNFMPLISQAQTEGLVPCGGPGQNPCKWEDLYTLIAKVINFMWDYIAIPLSLIFIAVGGIMIMTAGSSIERVKQGKKTITAAVVGLAITFGSWLIISLVIQALCTAAGSPASIKFNAFHIIQGCQVGGSIR